MPAVDYRLPDGFSWSDVTAISRMAVARDGDLHANGPPASALDEDGRAGRVARDYDDHSERAFTSSLRRCTICLVRRTSPSLRPAPNVDAIARKRAFKSL